MTQENKDLLLKYLCMTLPYGVMVNVEGYDTEKLIGIENETITTKATPISYSDKGEYPIDIVKPYLRPMSSMNLDECCELEHVEESYDTHFDSILAQINWCLKNHFDFMGLIPKGLAIEVTKDNNPYERID